MEADIDRVIFKAMAIGDLTEIEDTLRQARRLLYGALTRRLISFDPENGCHSRRGLSPRRFRFVCPNMGSHGVDGVWTGDAKVE